MSDASKPDPQTTAAMLEHGVKYEIVQEILSEEIGRHNEVVRAFGQDSPQGAHHLEAIRALVEAKDILDPDNHPQVVVAELLVRAHLADLRHPAPDPEDH